MKRLAARFVLWIAFRRPELAEPMWFCFDLYCLLLALARAKLARWRRELRRP
jgi:hypothetical protein